MTKINELPIERVTALFSLWYVLDQVGRLPDLLPALEWNGIESREEVGEFDAAMRAVNDTLTDVTARARLPVGWSDAEIQTITGKAPVPLPYTIPPPPTSDPGWVPTGVDVWGALRGIGAGVESLRAMVTALTNSMGENDTAMVELMRAVNDLIELHQDDDEGDETDDATD